ncbi:transcriptional regulator [Pseudomonas sp. RW407]|uniref:LysR family transcriptional regulator n=1 Tax=Pseudomonas sp. RW407 TaxID=2202894 RepID=UPI000D6F487A|nr:LysR family transcriptional regulator [Pseudomonas sp. RW407]PWU30663.1 transcriptional regulator [Pseudomonas sp. RW407]
MFIRQLNYLVALAREQHFGRAAEVCHVSQPALSAAIRSIEVELGIVIVQRGRRFQGFTADGLRVLAWARRVLADCEHLRDEARSNEADPQGTLRLGAIPAALPLVPLLTQSCLQTYPRIRHGIHTLPAEDILRKLLDYELDVGLTYMDDPRLARYQVIPLFRERYVLLAGSREQLNAVGAFTWEVAAQLPLCLLSTNMQCRAGIDALCAARDLSLTPQVETDSLTALCAHVRHSGFYSIVPHSVLCQQEAGAPLYAHVLQPVMERDIGLVVRRQDSQGPLLDAALGSFASLDVQAWADRFLPAEPARRPRARRSAPGAPQVAMGERDHHQQ